LAESEYENLWEAETYTPLYDKVEVIRLGSDPSGPRAVPAGARDALTQIWEKKLFPR
jgi:hypothetical protein